MQPVPGGLGLHSRRVVRTWSGRPPVRLRRNAVRHERGRISTWNVVDDNALRAQNLDSLAGKIMRINPATGQGVADNPYWNGDPNAARSKVWAYGVRNAYRFSVRPASGSPATVFAGDVGWNTTEEVDAVPKEAESGLAVLRGRRGAARLRAQAGLPGPVRGRCRGPSKWTKPITTYDHNGVTAAVTGGPFYTGALLRGLLEYVLRRLRQEPHPVRDGQLEQRHHLRPHHLRPGRGLTGRHPGRGRTETLLHLDRDRGAPPVHLRDAATSDGGVSERSVLDAVDEWVGAGREGHVEWGAGRGGWAHDHAERCHLCEGVGGECGL